jgi:glycosyltransferase involved in cell wall biosynthesis
MRVLHINTTDIRGGAAKAARRIVEGLNSRGVDCQMLVKNRESDDPTVHAPQSAIARGASRLRYFVDVLPTRLYRQRTDDIAPQWAADGLLKRIDQLKPDIVHLHWILEGFLSVETIGRIDRPVVWTLHDMWPFTGGCYYSRDCRKFRESCGACPQLVSNSPYDLTWHILRRKLKAWKNSNMVATSHGSWIVDLARQSALFRDKRVEMIMAGLDTDRYRPIDKMTARKILGLPLDKKLVAFGAIYVDAPAKGFHLLRRALVKASASEIGKDLELVVFGASVPPPDFDLNIPSHFLGRLHDDWSLVLTYSAADVFVVPSIQDVGPQTVAEAMACGTSCVGFNANGVKDRIEHKVDGYLAEPFVADDLARGVIWSLEDPERTAGLGKQARKKALNSFTLDQQAESFERLYLQLLAGR